MLENLDLMMEQEERLSDHQSYYDKLAKTVEFVLIASQIGGLFSLKKGWKHEEQSTQMGCSLSNPLDFETLPLRK